MNNSYIVSGSLIGDEGKGTLSDYLSNKYDLKENVRFNGGSQASHTVVVNDKTHKFSQLGSGMLNNSRVYLSDNTIVNLFNLVSEAKALSEITKRSVEDILSRVYVDSNSSIVTPYHSLINKIRELSLNDNSLGSVGTGVSEVYKLKQLTGLDLKVSDLLNGSSDYILESLFEYTRDYLSQNRGKISNELFNELISEKDIYYLTDSRNKDYMKICYKNLIESNLFNIVDSIQSFHKNSSVLFEGSQGLLLDRELGIKPNTTSLDTTNKYGIKLSNEIDTNPISIGCISSLISRHGKGILPTHDKYLDSLVHDKNQLYSYFQGVPRYGWFDAVLFRYSHLVNPNDYYFISGLDRLNMFDTLKICNRYIYYGNIDEEFDSIFNYDYENDHVYIYDIKRNSEHLKEYLSKCVPDYIELNSFKSDITGVNSFYDLPYSCIDYINMIELLTNTKINIVGIGPDRCQKLERRL